MRMYGTVMKITEKSIVVLCEDGTFRNLPRPSVLPGLGDKIPVTVTERPTGARKRSFKAARIAWPAAASILLLLGIVILLNFMPRSTGPLTVVAIDINPSIELGVASTGKVEEVKLVNDDAKSFVTKRQLEGKTFDEAVGQIIIEAEKQGFLEAGTAKTWIWMTLVPPENNDNPAFAIDRSSIAIKDSYKLELFTATPEQVKKAAEADLSINKYLVYEQAEAQGVQLDIAELRTHSIVSVLQAAGIAPNVLIKNNAGAADTSFGDYPAGNRPTADPAHLQDPVMDLSNVNEQDANKSMTDDHQRSTPQATVPPGEGVKNKPSVQAKNPNLQASSQDSKPTGSPGSPAETRIKRDQGIADEKQEKSLEDNTLVNDTLQSSAKQDPAKMTGNHGQESESGLTPAESEQQKSKGNEKKSEPSVDSPQDKAARETNEEDVFEPPAPPVAEQQHEPPGQTDLSRDEVRPQAAPPDTSSPSRPSSADQAAPGNSAGKGKP
ncbi:anti-sigma-I factor RsgI family protein [Paenibacillus macerans]|uniref:anti-sigma-I factor RsgI family protein n=1 Tax=Paenibacillus macerans TaxID=44252 RepID=UPI003D317FD0